MAVHTLQVTIGAGTRTQLSATPISARQVVFQNNAGHVMRLGDANVTTSRGAALNPNDSLNSGPVVLQHVELSQWYVAGTQNDVLDILYID